MAPFDPYHAWLGIDPAEHPLNFYTLLRLPELESDVWVILEAIDRQSNYVRMQLEGEQSEAAHQLLAQLNAAGKTLLVPSAKRRYDERLYRYRAEMFQAEPAA